MRQLPQQIAAVMAGTILMFALAVGVCSYWMMQAVDRELIEATSRQVVDTLSDEVARVRGVSLDYAKWDEMVQAVDLQEALLRKSA